MMLGLELLPGRLTVSVPGILAALSLLIVAGAVLLWIHIGRRLRTYNIHGEAGGHTGVPSLDKGSQRLAVDSPPILAAIGLVPCTLPSRTHTCLARHPQQAPPSLILGRNRPSREDANSPAVSAETVASARFMEFGMDGPGHPENLPLPPCLAG